MCFLLEVVVKANFENVDKINFNIKVRLFENNLLVSFILAS